MKVSFVKACGFEYMAQYDENNVFFTRKDPEQRDKMVIIELAYGEVRVVRVSMHKIKKVKHVPIDEDTRFETDPHTLIRAYAPLVEKVNHG